MFVYKYSTTGKYHEQHGIENQDAMLTMENSRYTLSALADGATSCRNSRAGAEAACSAAAEYFMRNGEALFRFDEKKISFLLTEQVMYKLRDLAAASMEPVETYAGTLLVCFTDKKDRRSIMYSLGDSALFRAQHGECSLVLSPVRYAGASCCLTTTKGAYKAARVKIESVLPSDAVFLCTDGIYTLMKDYSVEKEIKDAVVKKDYNRLCECVNGLEKADDCSFILSYN